MSTSLAAPRNGIVNQIISFSVYGSDPVYSSGAIANAVAARQFFPGWTARFYVAESLAGPLPATLKALGAECVVMTQRTAHDGMFWRFLPAGDPDVDVMIVRDVDALLCPRNKAVVDLWLESDAAFHIIRDHPLHRSLILGGLWGARGGVLREMPALIERWSQSSDYGDDIRFLEQMIYPLVATRSLIHSDYVAYAGESVKPIPIPRQDDRWLGFPPARGEISDQRLEEFKLLRGRLDRKRAITESRVP